MKHIQDITIDLDSLKSEHHFEYDNNDIPALLVLLIQELRVMNNRGVKNG